MVLAVCLLHSSCSTSDTTNNDTTTVTTITGTIDDTNITIEILNIIATKSSFNGLETVLSSQENGAADTTLSEGEEQLRIKIVDISQVTLDTPVRVGAGNDAVQFETPTQRFIGTSGTITFSSIGNTIDDEVSAAFDLGLVSIEIGADEASATLVGQFSTSVTASTTSE